jgi:hypothetical protein
VILHWPDHLWHLQFRLSDPKFGYPSTIVVGHLRFIGYFHTICCFLYGAFYSMSFPWLHLHFVQQDFLLPLPQQQLLFRAVLLLRLQRCIQASILSGSYFIIYFYYLGKISELMLFFMEKSFPICDYHYRHGLSLQQLVFLPVPRLSVILVMMSSLVPLKISLIH